MTVSRLLVVGLQEQNTNEFTVQAARGDSDGKHARVRVAMTSLEVSGAWRKFLLYIFYYYYFMTAEKGGVARAKGRRRQSEGVYHRVQEPTVSGACRV